MMQALKTNNMPFKDFIRYNDAGTLHIMHVFDRYEAPNVFKMDRFQLIGKSKPFSFTTEEYFELLNVVKPDVICAANYGGFTKEKIQKIRYGP